MTGYRWRAVPWVLSVAFFLLWTAHAQAVTYFDEQFADGILDPAILPFTTNGTTSSFLIEPGAHFGGLVGKRTAGTEEGNSLVGLITNDTDYNTADWVASAVLWRNPTDYLGGTGDIFFLGLGDSTNWGGDVLIDAVTSRAHVGWFSPQWGFEWRYDMWGWSDIGAGIESNAPHPQGSYVGGDNQEIALRMSKTGTSLLYEIDHNNDGSFEYSDTFDLTNPNYGWYDSSGSSIFVGYRRSGGTELASFTVAAVPEPGSLALAGLGLLGLCGWGWRRRVN